MSVIVVMGGNIDCEGGEEEEEEEGDSKSRSLIKVSHPLHSFCVIIWG